MEKYYSGKAIIKVSINGILIEEDSKLDNEESYPSTTSIKNFIEALVNQENSYDLIMFALLKTRLSYFGQKLIWFIFII